MIQNRKKMRLIEGFDGVIDEFEEVVVQHPARMKVAPRTGASLLSMLESTTTICLPIDEEVDSSLCLACDHFAGCHRDATGALVVVCWSHKRRDRLARGTLTMAAPKLD